MAVECGKIDNRTKLSHLLGNQEQSAVVPKGCHVGDPLYGPLQQLGIHGLLEVLPAVPGPEVDALVGQLRSLLECQTHPVLDNAGGPAVAQQTPPVRGEVCQASPHLDPVTSSGCGSCSSLLSLAALIWIGSVAVSPASASTKGLLLHCRSQSRSSCRWTKTIKHGCPGLTLLGRCWCFCASLVVFGLLNKSHRRSSHSVRLTDGPDSVL